MFEWCLSIIILLEIEYKKMIKSKNINLDHV